MRGSNTCQLFFDDVEVPEENVLGQIDAPGENWADLLARHLPAHPWASYHDVISTTTPPTRDTPCTVTDNATLADVLVRFWTGGELAVTDHATFRLSFATADVDKIREGVARLGQAI
jgi:DNA-binding transcriptional MocR family regulator